MIGLIGNIVAATVTVTGCLYVIYGFWVRARKFRFLCRDEFLESTNEILAALDEASPENVGAALNSLLENYCRHDEVVRYLHCKAEEMRGDDMMVARSAIKGMALAVEDRSFES